MQPITINAFLGANLAFDDILLPAGVGVASTNQEPGYGDLRPWKSPGAAVATVPTSPQRLTIYRMGQDVASEANYWLGWSTIVNAIRGFEGDDPTERTYYTGSGSPKWTNNIIGLGGGPPYPQAFRELSVPAPTTAITATINTNPATGSDVAFLWVYTFVNELGWESAPSPPSNTLVAKAGCTFNLAGFDSAPAGSYGIALVRLYRFVPGTSDAGAYFYLREWAVGATPTNPIDDARAVGSDPLATIGFRPPPANAHSLTKMWNGMFALASDKSVRVCEPYKHYAYPLPYQIDLPDKVIALATWSQRLLALTTGDAHVIAGSSPEGLDEEAAKINRPCASPRGVVEFNEGENAKGVVWPSEEGLCWYGDGGFRLVTGNMLTREQWQAMQPSTMVAGRVLGLYVCFYNDGAIKGFVIDPKDPNGIYMLTTGYDAVFRDPLTDRLYVLEGGNIKRWNAGASMTATFRSKTILLPDPVNIGALEVIAKGYPVTVKVWGDGVLRIDRSVPSAEIVRGTPGWVSDQLQFEVSATARVIALRVGETPNDLRRA